MTSARDEIIGRLQRHARPQEPLPPWSSARDFPDLTARFSQSLLKAHGEVHHASNLQAAGAKLQTICREIGVHRLVHTADALLHQLPLNILLPEVESVLLQPHAPITELCAQADIGVCGVVAALAETGTVVLRSGTTQSRLATLLPPVHVAFVPRTAIFTDLLTWVQTRPQPMPANITLVSGPSKTADIEQTMAIGVHGPRRFIVILLDSMD